MYGPFDPAVPSLGICLMDTLPWEQRDVGIRLFTVMLFIMATDGEQMECPSLGAWLNKFWHGHTMGCCTAVKKVGHLLVC